MGEVYLARDPRLDREVALKLLPRHLTADPEAIARFRREALTLASLTHPNIAVVYGFEETPEGPTALVLERVEGQTLAERLDRGALRSDEALQIFAQIAQALEAAHERGVIHRDVKPGNVMIGPRGLVKVLDFGLARRTTGPGRPTATEPARPRHPAQVTPPAVAPEEAETIEVSRPGGAPDPANVSQSGAILGTPGYMSPEQVLASEVDERTDVFAFGCGLYECLAGRRASACPRWRRWPSWPRRWGARRKRPVSSARPPR
jgi:serine/threonine protein kinase